MKFHIIGAVICVLIIAISILMPLASSDVTTRYHQHIEAEEKNACIHLDDVFCTHLPLVVITTKNGEEIPGKAVLGRDGEYLSYTKSSDGKDTIVAKISIIDSEDNNNHLYDNSSLESDAFINVRGRSSRAYDKHNYAIKLVTDEGYNNKLSVMGMDPHHEWALHGPYLDKTLIRNYMWYNISGEIMDYAPNVRFCEVFLNGEYLGVYLMTETVTAGENGARLSLTVNEKNNSYTGYLVELIGDNTDMLERVLPDIYSDNTVLFDKEQLGNEHEDYKLFAPFTTYSYRSAVIFETVYPGRRLLTHELKRDIEQDLSDFQKSLYSYDYDNERNGYQEYIDVYNFVDYFLINEFTCNYDAGSLSTFIYKDLDGRYRMCVWDFNACCDNYRNSFMNDQKLAMQFKVFYYMLFKDEAFVEKVIERYWSLRDKYLNEEYLIRYIDEIIEYLGPSIERNYEKWGYSFSIAYDQLQPMARNPRSFDEAIEQLKEYFPDRIRWMDENIDSLRQYAAESKVKKFDENAN